MAPSQKSLLLTGGLLPAKRSPRKSPGDGGVPAQSLPTDPPASPPGSCSISRDGEDAASAGRVGGFHTSPQGLYSPSGWGGGVRSPPRLTRRTGVSCGGPGDVGGFAALPVAPLISSALEHLRFPQHGRGWWCEGWGGPIPLLLSHSPGRPHLFLLFGSFAGSAIPAHPKGAGCSGSSWGEGWERESL